MIYHRSEDGYRSLANGIRMKTLVYGECTILCEFRIGGGEKIPLHHHPYEQTGYVVSGRIALTAGGDSFEAGPGDSWCIPKDVPHEAEVLADAVVVEVFSPVREDYLP